MKTNVTRKIVSILILFVSISSCVQDGNFDLPTLEEIEPNITPNSTISAIKSALKKEFNSSGSLTYTFFEKPSSPTFIEGYVVSSDASGNFYKTLIVQDKSSNPKAGIEIKLNDTSLSDSYEIGRKVYIMLDGLTVSYDDGASDKFINPSNAVPGKYILGILDGNKVADIPSTQIKKHIFRSIIIEKIIPTPLALADINGTHINTLIQLPTAQFLKEDLGKTYAGEPNDEFNGFRTIFEYGTSATLALQTSTFASFNFNMIPTGSGKITAVLSKDYRAEFLVGIVNTPSDVEFSEPKRFDPPILECTSTETIGGKIIIFYEDFEAINNSADLNRAGYTNVNVTGSKTIYSLKSLSSGKYVQISAYSTGENSIEAWLVTPEIDLEASTREELTFETSTGFDKGSALTAFISSDFSGDVTTATWIKLDAVLSQGPSSGFSTRFTNSGSINLSCLSGKVHLAFRYVGGDGGVTTTFQIDNIKITGN